MDRNKYIILIVIISAISLAYYVPHYGLIYDGGLYASLGYSLFSGNGYFFNGYPGDVPPILPIFLSLFIRIFGENGIFLVVPLFSIMNTVIIFLILEKEELERRKNLEMDKIPKGDIFPEQTIDISCSSSLGLPDNP